MSEVMVMLFEGSVVIVSPIDQRVFDSLQRDAHRIMGESPAKDGGYLESAQTGSSAYEYAQRILETQHPAAFVSTIPPHRSLWRRLVSTAQLQEIP